MDDEVGKGDAEKERDGLEVVGVDICSDIEEPDHGKETPGQQGDQGIAPDLRVGIEEEWGGQCGQDQAVAQG